MLAGETVVQEKRGARNDALEELGVGRRQNPLQFLPFDPLQFGEHKIEEGTELGSRENVWAPDDDASERRVRNSKGLEGEYMVEKGFPSRELELWTREEERLRFFLVQMELPQDPERWSSIQNVA